MEEAVQHAGRDAVDHAHLPAAASEPCVDVARRHQPGQDAGEASGAVDHVGRLGEVEAVELPVQDLAEARHQRLLVLGRLAHVGDGFRAADVGQIDVPKEGSRRRGRPSAASALHQFGMPAAQVEVVGRQQSLVALVGRVHDEGRGDPVELPGTDGGMRTGADDGARLARLQVADDGPGVDDRRAGVAQPRASAASGADPGWLGREQRAERRHQRLGDGRVARRADTHGMVLELQPVILGAEQREGAIAIHAAEVQGHAQLR